MLAERALICDAENCGTREGRGLLALTTVESGSPRVLQKATRTTRQTEAVCSAVTAMQERTGGAARWTRRS